MDVITTHVGADFDALASVIAASKLHPGARVVLSGGSDRNVADFLSLHQEILDFAPLKEIDLDAISTLIVVETQMSSRLGELGKVARRPGVRVVVYDHHERGGDIQPAEAVILPHGATTTILVERIREQGLPVTPLEATIFLLGIYEDTGSLTFLGTTPNDAEAAAWLLRRGANLEIVSTFLIRGLTPDQRALLNDLLARVRYHDVHGARVALSSAEAPRYVAEVALLTHRLADVEGADAVFVIVRMEGSILLVGRARSRGIDVARVMEAFGGGGHERAASATLKEGDPAAIEARILELLEGAVEPRATARDLMSWPVRSVGPDTPITEVGRALSRYGIGGLLIVDEGQPVGVILRRDVDRATHHGLSHAPVRAFMSRDVRPVAPDAPLREIEHLMLEEHVARVPVMEGDRLLGIITRTDVLRALHRASISTTLPLHTAVPSPERETPVADLLRDRLPERVRARLERAGAIGDLLGVHVFVVGGFVRDLILGVENLDVDLVVEDDGIAFAGRLADELRADAALHHRFGTARLTLPDGFRLDVASSRAEHYERPGALPVVEHSSLRDDLARRDFTINAMAIQLNARAFGRLVDPFRGRRDLRLGRVRVLHNLSFVEDPTRLFRGVRFEARYGFRLGPGSERLARSAIEHGAPSGVSPARLRKEVVLTLEEPEAIRAVERWEELGILAALWPGLALSGETRERWQRIDSVLAWYNGLGVKHRVERWLLLLAVIVAPLGAEVASRFIEARLHVRARHREVLRAALFGLAPLRSVLEQPWRGRGRKGVRASQVYWACKDLPVEALLLAVIVSGAQRARDRVALYLRELRHVRPRVTGDRLIEIGYPRSPVVGAALRELLNRRLDGELRTAEEELALARNWLEKGVPVGSHGEVV
ncbi:MAG: CBS domain-containing protein [Armatimonadetes bacterium]|nr:CBS domain-containing protein [Armatimonadota bacterium]